VYLHGTYFVVGHFHLTLAASVLLGGFAGIYYWFPKMFGKRMNEPLGKLHFIFSFLSVMVIFTLIMYCGANGMMRRVASVTRYTYLKPMQPWNVVISWGVLVFGLSQLFFIVNFVYSLIWGKVASINPWQAASLEWTVPSPPPHGNFGAALPIVYRGPHEFSNPDAENDWIMQTDPVGHTERPLPVPVEIVPAPMARAH